MVARVSGDKLECTSMGTTIPILLGRPSLLTVNGVNERLNFKWGPEQPDHLDLK